VNDVPFHCLHCRCGLLPLVNFSMLFPLAVAAKFVVPRILQIHIFYIYSTSENTPRPVVVTFHVVLEPIIILAMGYLSYILADMFDFSGIVR